MTIVLIGGEVSNKIGKVIKDTFDNVNVVIYNTLDKFCEDTSTRSLFFERMFITPDLFEDMTANEDKMYALSDYISKNYPEVRLITLSKTPEVYELNSRIFTSPIQLNIMLEKLSSTKIGELVSTPIEQLRHKYARETEASITMSKVEKQKAQVTPAPNKKKKEKRGFFGFGKKTAKKAQPEYVLEDEAESIQNEELEEDNKENEILEESEESSSENHSDDGFGSGFSESFEEASDISEHKDSSDDKLMEEEETTDFSATINAIKNKKSSASRFERKKIKPTEKSVDTEQIVNKLNTGLGEFVDENNDGIDDITGKVIDYTKSNKEKEEHKGVGVNKIPDISDEVQKMEYVVQDIVSSDKSFNKENIEEIGIEEHIAEVEEIEDESAFAEAGIEFGDISQLEEEYQTGSGNAHVIERVVEKVVEKEKIVEKPVYVNGSKGSASKLQLVTKGIESAIIVVTGDRRSGVTTLATKIATMFAQKLKVLYVDMDTERQGSLIHIGINELANEDDTVQRGLELIKSAKMLQHMAYCSSAVKYDSLVSIGEEKVKDEQLDIVGDVIMVQDIYNVVVVDCPFEKLHIIPDVVSVSNVIVCLEEDIGAIKNTTNFFEGIELPLKHKRTLYNNMNYCITRGSNNQYPAMFKQVNEFFETDDEINWSDVKKVAGTAKNVVKLMENIMG